MATTNSKKKTIYVGGLTEEVDEKVLRAAFIPFGDISEVQIPQDYETEKHRGFAFVDYELPEDAQGMANYLMLFLRFTHNLLFSCDRQYARL